MSDVVMIIIGLTVLAALVLYIYMEHTAKNLHLKDEDEAKTDEDSADKSEK